MSIMTKHCLLVLLMAIVGIQCMFAQTSKTSKEWEASGHSPVHASLYVEGGGQMSMYHSTDSKLDPEFSSAFGPTGGLGVNLRFLARDKFHYTRNGWMGLQAGVHYMKSGFKADGTKISGDYLCFPVDVQFYPIKDFYIGVGAEYCLNLNLSPTEVEIQGMHMSFDGKKSNDLKLSAGIGCLFRTKSNPIGVSLKFLMGTTEFMGNLPWKGKEALQSFS